MIRKLKFSEFDLMNNTGGSVRRHTTEPKVGESRVVIEDEVLQEDDLLRLPVNFRIISYNFKKRLIFYPFFEYIFKF